MRVKLSLEGHALSWPPSANGRNKARPSELGPPASGLAQRVGTGYDVRQMINPLNVLQAHLAELLALGARRIGVFGSFARGQARDNSDVDVYVEFDDAQRTYDNFFALHERLETLLGRRVDLVTDKSLTETKARLILPTVRYVTSHA